MKQSIQIVTLIMTVMFALAACSVLQEPEEASAPIEAVPLEVEAAETEVEAATDVSAEVIVEEESEATSNDGLTVFSISQDSSNVRFELDEDLRGSRFTVVGETSQVAGEIAVDFADLSTTQVGTIQINARTLVTDNNFRNRALNNKILETGVFEFITFTPTAVNDLPDSVAIGDAVEFSVVGDLTIRDVTTEVTFVIEATAVSDTELSGIASTVITREAYGLQIPSVPNVANVEEEVELYIDFVANAS
ncbi:MAG: YceI family protein [Chloroflexi bacterium]|nr:YceI family protein [Chloroflexota bacterium]